MAQANRQRNLAVEWTKHLPADKRGEFEKTARNSVVVLTRLKEIAQERLASLDDQEIRDDFYLDNNLMSRMILNNGRKQELKNILSLLAFL